MTTTAQNSAPAPAVNSAPKPAAATPAPAATAPAPTASGAALPNDQRLKKLVSQVGSLGAEASLGADALPKLAHAVVTAAAEGVIDLATKHKLRDGKSMGDVATFLYEKYAAQESSKAIHEHSKAGIKGNASKLRQLVSLGLMTTVDGVEVMNNAFTARDNMMKDDNKVKPAYVYYVEVAREQIKLDKPLSMRALETLAVKEAPEDKTLQDEVERCIGILEGLVTGENKYKLKDTSGKCEAAMHTLKELIAKMIDDQRRVALLQEAAKLGLKLA